MTEPIQTEDRALSALPDAPLLHHHDGRRSGKVRDIVTFGTRLLLVTTDRISTYDVVHPTPIPDKGRVLTGLSLFWFRTLEMMHHLVTANVDEMAGYDARIDFGGHHDWYDGRSMLVTRTDVFPIECVVRGYLAGSGWKEYRQSQSVCGVPLPPGLTESAELPEPIFTPATKAETGHDENITFDRMAEIVGRSVAEQLRRDSLTLYREGAAYARSRGILIADTKFEWGRAPDGAIILIDEVLTPDSSRFWPLDTYKPGGPQPSFDKQFVRDWAEGTGWDKKPPAPAIPHDVVARTRVKYVEAYERLTGQPFSWK